MFGLCNLTVHLEFHIWPASFPNKELVRLALGPGALMTNPLALTESLPPMLFNMLKIMENIIIFYIGRPQNKSRNQAHL